MITLEVEILSPPFIYSGAAKTTAKSVSKGKNQRRKEQEVGHTICSGLEG